MNLTIDTGNTHIKAAVFEDGQLVETFKTRDGGIDLLGQIFAKYPGIKRAISVSTRGYDEDFENSVRSRVGTYIRFDHNTKIPLSNMYATPETLGYDRMAAAAGANAIYPECNVLIVDFGTAITFDMVTKSGEFLGGSISPGAETRFRALHEYTSNLPLGKLADESPLIAASSLQAVESGVANGILFEIEGYVSRLSGEYEDLKIIFTGGDGNFFAKRLKNTIFATYDLVVYGLNRILEYNAD